MAISSTINRIAYTGNGAQTAFTFPYIYYDQTQLLVYVNGVLQTLASTYTVNPAAANPEDGNVGGTVTFLAAPANAASIVILRSLGITQSVVLNDGSNFPAKTIEKTFDQVTMMLQQHDDAITRSIRALPTEALDMTLPAAAIRANTYLAFGSDGKPVAASLSAVVGTSVVATGTVVSRTFADRFGETYNAADFGTLDKTGATDMYAILQAWINACIADQKKGVLPIGVYKISQPLMIMKFSGGVYSYFSCELEGGKHAWEDESGLIHSTRIVPTFNNVPAIIIQGGRSVKLKNLAVLGLNTFDIGNGLTAPYYPEMMTNSTFVTGGCRDSQYSPYTGICVDPFGTALPPDGGYPGLSGYYVASAAGSSRTMFESVTSKNFVVGFCLTPNNTTQNNEDVEFLNCRADFNKVGLAVCQSQSRNVNWRGGNAAFNLIGFDNNLYGVRTGGVPHISGCNMSGKYLFNLATQYGNTPNIQGIHAESFASIGFVGSGSTAYDQPVSIHSSEFAFSSMGGKFPDHHFVAYAPVKFIGCDFSNLNCQYGMPIRFYHRHGLPISFDTCSFGGAVQNECPITMSVGVSVLDWANVNFNRCHFGNDGAHGTGQGYSPLTNDLMMYGGAGYIDGALFPPGSRFKYNSGTNPGTLYFDTGVELLVSLGSVTVTTGALGTATFTVADGTIVRVGDMIGTTTAVTVEGPLLTTALAVNYIVLGVVTSVVGNNITISGWPQSLSTGTYALVEWWWPRFHEASTGNTHSNTTLDNVSPVGAWAIGQKIRGAGITDGTYITNIIGTTITLSKAASATTVGIRLYDADIYSITGTAV